MYYHLFMINFCKLQVENLRQDKNIRFTRFQDNKTILHLGAERNAVKVVIDLVVFAL